MQVVDFLDLQITAKNYADFEQLIVYLNHHYYMLSTPKITDAQFDSIMKRIEAFEVSNADTIPVHKRISNQVAYGIQNEFEPFTHLSPMLSLQNSYGLSDIEDFIKSTQGEVGENFSFTMEPKLDGSSISLIYDNDRLIQATTRGNGQIGESITLNAKFIQNLPHSIEFSSKNIKKIELRGECVISRKNFLEINQERQTMGLNEFQNPRNLASGSLRLKSPQEIKARKVEVFLYGVGFIELINSDLMSPQTHFEIMEILDKIGLPTTFPQIKIAQNTAEIIDVVNYWESYRHEFDYDTDGLVVKINEIPFQEYLGQTAHHPKWAFAYKFKAEEKISEVQDIVFQVGRTGVVTPVAKLAPVNISGVMVSSVSLHNEDFIREKDIRIGDQVYVERAGEVIPYISSVVIEARKEHVKPFEYIRNCPSCSSDLVRETGLSAVKCINANCKAQQVEKIIYFVSKEAMDIKGLGRDIVKKFIDNQLIEDFPSIYRMDKSQIQALEGFKDKSAQNIIDGIQESKSNPLYRLIVGLGIEHVGTQLAKSLAKKVTHLVDFSTWTIEDYQKLDDVGPKVAESLQKFFQNDENITLLKELEALGVNLSGSQTSVNGKLFGLTIVFSGFRDASLQSEIESYSGQVANSLSKKTDILVVKDISAITTKILKAQENGTKIMSLENFLTFMAKEKPVLE